MSYTVLARRYRSREFEEIVGQEPIARTLRNAIATDRTAHAYLFSGTRGVGKTSMARIFAKAMNLHDDLQEKDAIAEAILRGDDLDVIEIDGASNRGVNEARDLIAGAGLSPSRCPNKIYIIDEVHMLTREAFNALLKTMEEPPAHVKFILCTTEPHKVPATIQSRCQRFDFKPISTLLIAQHLREILTQEKLEADEEVTMQVARLGNGSMRDALSLLDRLLAAGDSKLTSEMLELMLGLPDQALVRDLIGAIAGTDPKLTLEQGGRILSTGASVEQALDLLTETFRDLMIITACGEDSALIDHSPETKQALSDLASSFDTAGLVHLIALCESARRNAQGSVTGRALFDATIVRMAMSEHLADIPAMLQGDSSRIQTSAEAKPSGGSKKKALLSPPAPSPPEVKAPASRGTEPDVITEVKTVHTQTSSVESTVASGGAKIDESSIWAKVLKAADRSPIMKTLVDDLNFDSLVDNVVGLSLNEHGQQRARYILTQKEKLETFISKTVGLKVKVTLDVSSGVRVAAKPVSGEMINEVQNIPIVRRAMDLFDATVIDVRDDSRSATRDEK